MKLAYGTIAHVNHREAKNVGVKPFLCMSMNVEEKELN